ncbi:MAG: pilin [Candidatus Liptonbacteria bacterium]
MPTADPGQLVLDIYNFALIAGGLLAFGAIVYGAIMYGLSGGNTSLASDAKDQITQAVMGLILLFLAYILLNIINPSMVNLRLPKLDQITVDMTPNNNAALNGCRGGCEQIFDAKLTCKDGCTADRRVVQGLMCITSGQSGYPPFWVTEAYPPTIAHSDPGHNNGCAIDVALTGTSGACSADLVNKLMNAANKCGFTVLNEYTCGYSSNPSARSTGGHLHMRRC